MEIQTTFFSSTAEVAWIDEDNCIGCAKCSQVCPVDAIIGSKHTVHTVVSSLCTGCKLCITPCPTDCIKINSSTLASRGCLSKDYR
ncbi:RnfABCDGE type electron transport complex subunit B [Sodalis sp. CWE]|nr:RnfABCDGE type electron transport complex subunit B [Sodalis sp. CWE]